MKSSWRLLGLTLVGGLLVDGMLEQIQVGPPFARITIPPAQAALLYDYENFHAGSTNGIKNVLYGDGHVAPLR